MRCEACGSELPAADLECDSLARLEGASDPADMAAVIALTCPSCSAKVCLVVRYGPEASAADSSVLLALPDHLPEPRDPGATT